MHCIWANAWVRQNFVLEFIEGVKRGENPYDPGWIGPAIGVPRYSFEKIEMGRE
jgi:hypothetical protein